MFIFLEMLCIKTKFGIIIRIINIHSILLNWFLLLIFNFDGGCWTFIISRVLTQNLEVESKNNKICNFSELNRIFSAVDPTQKDHCLAAMGGRSYLSTGWLVRFSQKYI